MRRRAIGLLVVGLITFNGVLPATAQVSPDSEFVDVSTASIFYGDIQWLSEQGITTGCDAAGTKFCPSGYVTRAEMAAFLLRLLGEESNLSSYQGQFADVPNGLWYTLYVEHLYDLGITTGYANGTYGPNDLVSRGEMAALLLRAIGQDTNLGTYQGTFTDVTNGLWYTPYVELFFDLGLTGGYGDGTYRPNNPVTRAEMAAFLHRSIVQGDLDQVDTVLPEADSSTQPFEFGGNYPLMADFMTTIINDVGNYWVATLGSFYAEGYWPFAYYYWVTPGDFSATTVCSGGVDPLQSAFYCSGDDTIFISTQKMVDWWDDYGDFAVAYVIAHEYAHNIQGEFGILGNYPSINVELQADCLAGNWANHAYWSGYLDGTDITEALTLALDIGGVTHGTGEQRNAAFMLGYNTGQPGAGGCADILSW